MKARLSFLAGVTALAALAAPVSAAPAPQVTDIKGDANGVNGQGRADGDLPSNNTATPGSQDGYDIISVTYETKKDAGKASHLVVTLELAGKVATTAPAIFRTLAETSNCGTLYFQYRIAADAAPASTMEYCNTAPSGLRTVESLTVSDFVIQDNKLQWTVSLEVTEKLQMRFTTGTVLKNLGALTLVNLTRSSATPAGANKRPPAPVMGALVQVDAARTELSYTIA